MGFDVTKFKKLCYFNEAETKSLQSHCFVEQMQDIIKNRLQETKYSVIAEALRSLPLCIRIRTNGVTAFKKNKYTTTLDLVGYSVSKQSKTGVILLDIQNEKHSKLQLINTEWQKLSFDISSLVDFFGEVITRDIMFALEIKSFLEEDHQEVEEDRKRRPKQRWILEQKNGVATIFAGSVKHEQFPLVGNTKLKEIVYEPRRNKGNYLLSVGSIILPRGPKHHISPPKTTIFLNDAEPLKKWYQRNLIPPKNDELLGLLQLAYCPTIDMRKNFAHQKITDNFSIFGLMPLISWLNESLAEIKRQYVRRPINSKSPSGSIDFGRYAKNMATGRLDIVPLQKFIYSYDSVVNRVLKGVAHHCAQICNRVQEPLFKKFASQLRDIETQFSQTKLVYPTASDVQIAIKVTSSPVIKQTLLLCADFLSGKYITFDFWGEQNRHTRNFEINMTKLFENAAREFLQLCVPNHNVIDGNKEQPSHMLTWKHHDFFNKKDLHPVLLPDFLVLSRNQVKAIGDAKYKLLNQPNRSRENTSFEPLKINDFYQVVSYMSAWSESQCGVVLFPEANVDENRKMASKLVSVLSIQNRKIGIFSIQASHFLRKNIHQEPLYQWMNSFI